MLMMNVTNLSYCCQTVRHYKYANDRKICGRVWLENVECVEDWMNDIRCMSDCYTPPPDFSTGNLFDVKGKVGTYRGVQICGTSGC